MKNYTAWLKTAAIIQLIMAGVHLRALLSTPSPRNESEKQLYNLMNNYHLNLGHGFHPTFGDLSFALSSCFSLLCIFAALINWHLVVKKAGTNIMTGIIHINLLVFGITFVLMLRFAFLLPVVLVGLIFLSLVIARFTIKSRRHPTMRLELTPD